MKMAMGTSTTTMRPCSGQSRWLASSTSNGAIPFACSSPRRCTDFIDIALLFTKVIQLYRPFSPELRLCVITFSQEHPQDYWQDADEDFWEDPISSPERASALSADSPVRNATLATHSPESAASRCSPDSLQQEAQEQVDIVSEAKPGYEGIMEDAEKQPGPVAPMSFPMMAHAGAVARPPSRQTSSEFMASIAGTPKSAR